MVINFIQKLDFLLWNGFLIYLLLIVGIFLTIKLKGVQFRYLKYSLSLAFKKHNDNDHKGDISQFQSLMTALAATIGIGAIAGMSTAIITGGFGAVFWMWVVSLIGMATKYAEALLAVKFRVEREGNISGGPMYYIKMGLNKPILAALFAFFGIMASFCGGNLIQSQTISDSVLTLFNVPTYITGIFITLLTAFSIIKGIKSLGKINSILVPFMALIYILSSLVILILKYNFILPGIYLIVKSAFNFKSAAGGFIGYSFMQAIQMGIARGISSNEAGLGSAPIASAAAKTDYPSRQALISMSGVFLSSFVVCTLTVLVLAVTNVVGTLNSSNELLTGAPLVMHAFNKVIPFGNHIVAICVFLFGFSTILGWAYYGEKCFEFIFKNIKIIYFRFIYIITVFMGSILSINIVWPLADIFNGLMAVFNLIGLFMLSNIAKDESDKFFKLIKINKDRNVKASDIY